MRLLVVSYKSCWPIDPGLDLYGTDGGFPFQMKALSELFDATRLCLPSRPRNGAAGEILLEGHNLKVVPISTPAGKGIWRKLGLPLWMARSGATIVKEIWRADAVHAPIPGDIGSVGMLLAYLMKKPLFVRHCGNWFVQTTTAEHLWKWFMEKVAGGRNVMLATGGAAAPPSERNPNLQWIFATSLTKRELLEAAPAKKTIDASARLIIVCRQELEKGTGVVIESLPLILNEFPYATLDVVGDGSALSTFKQLAVEHGVEKQITFHGKVDHGGVCSLLRKADVFCYPTTSSEGFPKAVLEALAHGLPVVTTNVSVLPTLIATGCGSLIANVTATDLAQGVIQILKDRARYSEMSAQAVNTARQYSLERWRDSIGELLRSAWGQQLRSDT